MREQPVTNLNALTIFDKDAPAKGLDDLSVQVMRQAYVRCYMRNLPAALIAEIEASQAVVGCVAWLTHPGVLRALSGVHTQIILQKEDFLRPDYGQSARKWKYELRRAYNALRCGIYSYHAPDPIQRLGYACPRYLDPVRCLGSCREDGVWKRPLMHHKFMVFCDFNPDPVGDVDGFGKSLTPRAVWTGSFNPTSNGANSFENAVVVQSPSIASAYLHEWAQLYALSEDLEWESPGVAPDQWLGT